MPAFFVDCQFQNPALWWDHSVWHLYETSLPTKIRVKYRKVVDTNTFSTVKSLFEINRDEEEIDWQPIPRFLRWNPMMSADASKWMNLWIKMAASGRLLHICPAWTYTFGAWAPSKGWQRILSSIELCPTLSFRWSSIDTLAVKFIRLVPYIYNRKSTAQGGSN